MRMTAVIDPTGTLELDLEGEKTTALYASVMDARRSVMSTATELAAETSTATELHIEDPSGSRTILMQTDGDIVEQTTTDTPNGKDQLPAKETPQVPTAPPVLKQTEDAAPAATPAPVAGRGSYPVLLDAPAHPSCMGAGHSPDRGGTVTVTSQGNPFVREPEVASEEDPIDDDPILGHRESVRGPRNIQQTLASEPVGEEEESAPPVAVTSTTLWLVGASGGVGTSTLAGLCSESIVDESERRPTWAGRALLVCSTSASSLEAAQQLARKSASGQLPYELVGLVIVHDRPKNRLTKPTLDFARGVARMFPVAMTAPYEPSWREVGVTPQASGTRLKSVLRKIEKTARSGH
ncbi:hypothetical protein IWX65_002858 [Arthrobacter sp. CAN_A214]|uniref:DUF6668 family protein n=1 Tax=Arthrobacter sp. CAN_A214 TaxID=2787720 RepID=UPI0018C95944